MLCVIMCMKLIVKYFFLTDFFFERVVLELSCIRINTVCVFCFPNLSIQCSVYEHLENQHSSGSILISYGLDNLGFNPQHRQDIFLFSTRSHQRYRPTQLPIHWPSGVLSLCIISQDTQFTTPSCSVLQE